MPGRLGAQRSMPNIWGNNGRKIGEVKDLGNRDQNTYDEHGQPLGKVRKQGTYDKNAQKISSTRDAGLTFGSEDQREGRGR
jgi:hypothetical protein